MSRINYAWGYPLLAPDGTTTAPSYAFASATSTGIVNAAGTLVLTSNSNTTQVRDGANSQVFEVFRTYTDASNYSGVRLFFVGAAISLSPIFSGSGSFTAFQITGGNNGTGPLLYLTSTNLQYGTDLVGWYTMDVTAFFPQANGVGALGKAALGWKQLFIDYTNTATVGNVTINKASGRVNLGAGATTLTVQNTLVTAASHIFLNSDGAPGNLVAVLFYAVPAAGSFTVNAVPAVTNQTAIDFFVVNAD